MDYLCELPNDATRRKALGSLPPTLNATYERILRRVNASNSDVQTLVSRTLRWIIHRRNSSANEFTIEVLCEAVAVNFGDTSRDTDTISDEFEILRWCSSLVRRSTDGNYLELAHFTVREFLQQIGENDDGEFALYRVGPGHGENELAKVCLTYLSYDDFDKGGRVSKEITLRRFGDYPLRQYAVENWSDHAEAHLDDGKLFSLVKNFLSPSKPNTLITWAQDLVLEHCWTVYEDAKALATLNSAIAESTALHYAAMLALPEGCKWLIDRGCDVNRITAFGTPLHCGLMGRSAFSGFLYPKSMFIDDREPRAGSVLVNILLEGGADPNCYSKASDDRISPLLLALSSFDSMSTIMLLDKGGVLDESCLDLLENDFEIGYGDADFEIVVNYARKGNIQDEHYSRFLELVLRTGSIETSSMLREINLGDEDDQLRKVDYQPYLRTAAEFGQLDVITRLLRTPRLNLDAADEDTGLTALPYAAMRGHVEIVKLLLHHGAQSCKTDYEGRAAIHHATKGNSLQCLQLFLDQDMGSSLTDIEGLTIWHLAALTETKQVLDMLLHSIVPVPILDDLKANDGTSLLMCAASVGSEENVTLLIQAGCRVVGTADDGSTTLHQAVKSGSLGTVRILLDNGSDVHAVAADGSTMLHYALTKIDEGVDAMIKLLIMRGVDPCRARNDGIVPIDLLIGDGTDDYVNLNGWRSRDKRMAILQTLAPLVANATHGDLLPFNLICQLQPSAPSGWLLTLFKAFLANGADLGSKAPSGRTALQSLADGWHQSCEQRQSSGSENSFSMTSTEMMRLAMEVVPLAGPLHEICADPRLIMSALLMDKEDLVYKFLEHHPDVDAAPEGCSVIKAACANGCSGQLLNDLLVYSKISCDKRVGSGLVRASCQANLARSYENVKVLLNAGLTANDSCPVDGETPLMIAARHGNVDMMNLLIFNGADPHALDKGGCNVIHYACRGGHLASLRVIKNLGVDWNRKARCSISGEKFIGVIPFHLAAMLENNHILEYFIDESLVSDIDTVADSQFTALFIAAWLSRPENVSTLLAKNADLTVRNIAGENPLHVAIRCGHEATVEAFLRHGCDVEVTDGSGLNCELIARKYGHTDLARMLREYQEEQGKLVWLQRRLLLWLSHALAWCKFQTSP